MAKCENCMNFKTVKASVFSEKNPDVKNLSLEKRKRSKGMIFFCSKDMASRDCYMAPRTTIKTCRSYDPA